ncbi:MAG: C4-type zinc ribbon domain-containing protein [Candidatus Wallbacteria bacterium]|nr:C4-type zinc ribbon domain-containing protein [Candidatus Wallbacteria bacterium]
MLKIGHLLMLQDCLYREKSLTDLRTALEDAVTECKNRIQTSKTELGTLQHEDELCRKKLVASNQELKEMEFRIKHTEEKLREVTSERQLKALEQEKVNLDLKRDEAELASIELMDQCDQLMPRIKRLSDQVLVLELELKGKQESLELRLPEVVEQLAALSSEKQKVSTETDPSLLSLFTRLHGKYLNVLVPVKNCICTGCNISLDHQTVNQLSENIRLISCPNCKRILYLEDILAKR